MKRWARLSSPDKYAILIDHFDLLGSSRKPRIFGRELTVLSGPNSLRLRERAKLAAKQMGYFHLFSKKGSFEGLAESAKRAGFMLAYEDTARKVAGFRWASGQPDFIFLVSYEDPEAASVIAQSQRDIFGLIMISHSHLPKISVEMKPLLEKRQVGRNARQFREILLTFPDFDAGTEELSRFQI
jgi:hypothetical protein